MQGCRVLSSFQVPGEQQAEPAHRGQSYVASPMAEAQSAPHWVPWVCRSALPISPRQLGKDLASSTSCRYTKGFFLHLYWLRIGSVVLGTQFSMDIVPPGRTYRKLAILLCANKNKLVWSYRVSPSHTQVGVQESNSPLPLTYPRSA